MKLFSDFFKYLLIAAACLSGAVSCSDDKNVQDDPLPGEKITVTLQVTAKTYASVTFTIATQGAVPTLYAYKAVEKGTVLTAEEVFDQGIKAAVKSEPFTLTGLTTDTDYTLFAVAMGEAGLSQAATAEFHTDADSGAPLTSRSIGIRLNSVGEQSLNFTLQRGSEVTSGYMAIWPTVSYDNLVYEGKKESPDITEEELVAGWLTMGYGMQIDGTEQNADWLAQELWPDGDYTVMLLGMVDETMGDVTTCQFHTGAYELIGDPKVTLTVESKNYMSARIRYTLNADAFGYMRYITDKSEIDTYMETHTEDDLREFTRFNDGLFEVLGQLRYDLEDTDEQGNLYKIQSTNFGWSAGGHEFTAMAVACDKNLSVSKRVERIDFRLEEFPEGTAPALFTCEARNIAADNLDLHFEFDESCLRAYCTVMPASSYRRDIEQAGGDLAVARQLWDSGWAIVRVNDADPTSAIANQDDFFMDEAGLYAGNEYVIVATGLNYQGVLNETLTVSEPFRMKDYSYENSDAVVNVDVDNIGKTSARALYKTNDKTRVLYNVTVEKDYVDQDLKIKLVDMTDKQLWSYLMNKGNVWPYFHEEDEAWDPSVQCVTYTWPEMIPGKEYVIFACGQDGQGRISEVSRKYFTTLKSNPGPNPKVELKAYDIAATSCKVDIAVNEDVQSYIYALIDEGMLNYIPGKDSQEVLDREVRTVCLGSGVMGYDSVSGLKAESLSYCGTYYLAAIAYGSEDGKGNLTEDFRYVKVQLTDTQTTSVSTLPDQTMSLFRRIAGGEEKSFGALKKANLESTDRNPVNAEGVVYVRDDEDAADVLDLMGGYRPMGASLKNMKKF